MKNIPNISYLPSPCPTGKTEKSETTCRSRLLRMAYNDVHLLRMPME